MNMERMTKLRDFMAALPDDKVCMSTYIKPANSLSINVVGDGLPTVDEAVHTCGTTACIAGWAVLLFKDCIDPSRSTLIERQAGELLGLTTEERRTLFLNADINEDRHCLDDGYELNLSQISQEEVVEALTYCIEQGTVPDDTYTQFH